MPERPPPVKAVSLELARAFFLGAPSIHLFTISVEEIRPMCMDLSPAVAAVVPEAVRAVRGLAGELIAS